LLYIICDAAIGVFEYVLWAREVNAKIVTENPKNMEMTFLHEFPSKRWVRSGICSIRSQNDERI